MSYEHIRWELDGAVGVITLDRPDTLNAVNWRLLNSLIDCIAHVEESREVRALVLTGAGRGFCSGADQRRHTESSGTSEVTGKLQEQGLNPAILSLRAIEKPVIAAVNGVAVGAGLALALACDIRIASDQARFSSIFVRIGLAPDSGVSWLLPRVVGPERARELTFSGRIIDAKEAFEIGLVSRVVPHDSLMKEAMDLARTLAAGPTVAIGLAKREMNYAESSGLADALAFERLAQAEAVRTHDAQEGRQAFLEKRPAKFTGA